MCCRYFLLRPSRDANPIDLLDLRLKSRVSFAFWHVRHDEVHCSRSARIPPFFCRNAILYCSILSYWVTGRPFPFAISSGLCYS